MTEKTAVFAPMPTAITRIATTVNAGAFSSERTAKRTSCQMYSRETKEEASGVGRLARLGWGMRAPVNQRIWLLRMDAGALRKSCSKAE